MKLPVFLSSNVNFLWALFLFALVIRLAYVLPLPLDRLSGDAYDWIRIAWAIAQGQGFGDSIRAPGYAFFLAGIFSIFGKSIVAARVIQAIMGAVTCVFLYWTGKKIFTETTGRIAGILVSFYPYLIAYSGDLFCETFLAFMLAGTVYQIVKTGETPSWKNIAIAGVLMGATGLTKAVALPFFMLACAWLWWQTGKFRLGFLTGIFTLLTITPWALRNHYHYGNYSIVPINAPHALGYSLYTSCCDEALLNEAVGDNLKGPGIKPIDQFLPPDHAYTQSLPLPEREKYYMEKSISWIKANPDKFLWVVYKRLIHFWRLYPMIAYKWEKAAAIATSGLYLPMAALGAFLSLAAFKKTSLLLALFASYTLLHIFFTTALRYRIPIDPFIMIFTAYALDRVYRACKIRLQI